ncbi:hypothetical protein BKA66DRAFT_221596 [Pyrenochaeta sp. MPI-SDFR-AT-0127]|nr:hypothetical protein BKA66DRAFT_221596 [Pyrenochaeta sp. MPI-SDFR-AT-0127]
MAVPSTNIAWTIPASASAISDLTKVSKDIPTPGPNQVLVKLNAATLNFRDILVVTRSPQYPGDHKAGLVPGLDGAGIITSTHTSSAWARKLGTKVILHPNNWLSGDISNLSVESTFGANSQDGTLQQYLVVDDEWVVPAPASLNAVESASLVTAGTTAWSAIREFLDGGLGGGLRAWEGSWTEKRLKGKTVLTMGTGGVSCFGIQIAAALGATVIATSSSSRKLDIAKSLGATHVVNYVETPEWDQEVLRLTGGKGVDHVIETGGSGTLMKSINATRPAGLISVLGILTPNAPLPAELVPNVLFSAKIVKGCMAFTRDSVAELAQFIQANNIKPAIAQEFEFEQVIEAFEALKKLNSVGKIVVKISDA